MAEKGWKRAEREIAARLGGLRVPVTGRARGDVPDVEAEGLAVEVKHRPVPGWIREALSQAEAAAKDGELPLVVLHQPGTRYDAALVLARLEDIVELLKSKRSRP